jgi:HEAT repeat protein
MKSKINYYKLFLSSIYLLLLFSFKSIYSNTEKDLKIYNGLQSKKIEVVVETIRSIKESNANHFIPSISKLLKKDNLDKEIIIEIINLYESYGDDLISFYPSAFEDYEWLLGNLKDEKLIFELINVLYQKKDKRFIYSILALITNRSSSIREISYKYLKIFKDDRILPYILELGNSDNPLYRYYYLESLEFINDERANLHVPKLINDESAAIRYEAIKLMDQFQIKDKENNILQLAKNDQNYEVRKVSIIYAKNRKLKNKINIFIEGLEDPNFEVREASLESIHSFKEPNFAKYVSNFLEVEKNPILKLKAIESLITMKNDGGGNGLAAILLHDKNSEVRMMSAVAIGNISTQKKLTNTLNESLNVENDIDVKTEIIKSISKKKEKSSIPSLINKLKNQRESIQIKIVSLKALEEINDPSILPEIFDLIDTQNDISQELRIFVRNMLIKFHGKNHKETKKNVM